MRYYQSVTIVGLLCVLGILLSGCKGGVAPALPVGQQTETGVLLPIDLSAMRRGTHELLQNEERAFFVESPHINLHSFDHQRVVLRGVFEHNTDYSLAPVLVVDSLESLEDVSMDWESKELGISLQVPARWSALESDGTAQFTLTGSTQPVVSIYKDSIEKFPSGIPIVVDSLKAVRILRDGDTSQEVYVQRKNDVLVLLFTPGEDAEIQLLREQWLQLLRTMHIVDGVDEIGTTVPTQTGSTITPCGGPAGVLCPQGYYCEITDSTDNVGKCRKIGG